MSRGALAVAYETRAEIIYRVLRSFLNTRMEIQYFVVGQIGASNLVHVRASQTVRKENQAHVTVSKPGQQENLIHILASQEARRGNVVHVFVEQKVEKENRIHIQTNTWPPHQNFVQVRAIQRLPREDKAHVRAYQTSEPQHNSAYIETTTIVRKENRAHVQTIQQPPYNNFVQVRVSLPARRFNRIHATAEVKLPLLWKRIGANDPFWRIIPPHKR